MQGFKQSESKAAQKSRDIPLLVEEISDETLIRTLALGMLWSLETLYQRYSRLLYSIAYRMVTDHQIAEDLLQETFIAIWQNASSYSAKSGAVQSWLVAIVRHRCIDYLRKLRSHQHFKTTPIEELLYDENLTSPDVWEEAWRSMRKTLIREALMLLSQEQRMVIELAYFEGQTHSEIAERYHIPLGTVKARMRLGIVRLKHIMGQMEGDT